MGKLQNRKYRFRGLGSVRLMGGKNAEVPEGLQHPETFRHRDGGEAYWLRLILREKERQDTDEHGLHRSGGQSFSCGNRERIDLAVPTMINTVLKIWIVVEPDFAESRSG